jgi:hypothetical protein
VGVVALTVLQPRSHTPSASWCWWHPATLLMEARRGAACEQLAKGRSPQLRETRARTRACNDAAVLRDAAM